MPRYPQHRKPSKLQLEMGRLDLRIAPPDKVVRKVVVLGGQPTTARGKDHVSKRALSSTGRRDVPGRVDHGPSSFSLE
jgi:hypothetical protein